MLNVVILMGRLTRDPELRRTNSGKPVASFAIAVDRDFAPQGGEKETDFIDIVTWNGTAEFVEKYFKKGSMIALKGRLQLRDWTDKDGNKRRTAEVVADQVWFGESKKSQEGGNTTQGQYGHPGAAVGAGGYQNQPQGYGCQAPQVGGFQGQVYQPPQSYNGAGGQQGYQQQGFGGYQPQGGFCPPYNPGGFQQIDGPDEQSPF